ncbi:MAG: carbohydrate ABC transporter permease [Trueperaceae bacterium]
MAERVLDKAKLRRSIRAWLLLLPLIIVVLFPYAVMLFTSVTPRAEVFSFPPRWLPSEIRWQNFVEMWEAANFGRVLLNSVVVALGSTLLTLAVAIPAAYATSRYRFRGQGVYRQFLLITQMLSPIVLIVGIFRLMVVLGLVDNLFSLVLAYAAFNLAFSVWMLHSYFRTIPPDVEEAAWIDGASRVQSLALIFIPMAVPAMAVVALFAFIFAWNDFVLALTLLRSSENFTLTLAVYSLVGGRYTVEWHQVMAATLLATAPIAVMFVVLQRYFMQGLSMGSIK